MATHDIGSCREMSCVANECKCILQVEKTSHRISQKSFCLKHLEQLDRLKKQMPTSPPEVRPDNLLDSWKEIAGYLERDVRTVQRWEKKEGLPVHRHHHEDAGTVYAFKSEIDEWKRERAVKNPNNGEGCVSLVNARVPVAAEKRTHRKPLLMRPLPVLLSLSALIVVGAFLFRFARTAPGRLEVTEAKIGRAHV